MFSKINLVVLNQVLNQYNSYSTIKKALPNTFITPKQLDKVHTNATQILKLTILYWAYLTYS